MVDSATTLIEVTIGSDELESRAVDQFDKHVIVLHALDHRRGKCFKDAPLARVAVDAVPDRLARLLLLGETMPIRARVLPCQFAHGVEDNLILACAAMPDGHQPVMRAIDQGMMECLLVPSNAEFVDIHFFAS